MLYTYMLSYAATVKCIGFIIIGRFLTPLITIPAIQLIAFFIN